MEKEAVRTYPLIVRKVGRWLKKTPPLSFLRRFHIFWFYYGEKVKQGIKWSSGKTVETNFYYGLSERNRAELASSVAAVFGKSPETVSELFDEILRDEQLQNHLGASGVSRTEGRGASELVGRRIVWYAITRITKPKTVIETGVDQGLGALVLCTALLRNRDEGNKGNYFGTEINPNGGWLLSGKYLEVGQILYGDSIESLQAFDGEIDLFINDSDHDEDYEAEEYEIVTDRLSGSAVVLGDNSHVTSRLSDWSRTQGRPYIFLKEEPEGHWYPGGGIGISLSQIPFKKTQ